jgi:hypothetical protein
MVDATLTPYLDGLPAVEVFFSNFGPEVHHHTIYRLSGNRMTVVRGAIEIATDVAVLDYEAPLGVSFRYATEMFTAAGGSLGFASSEQTILNIKRAFVHQPLNPQMWVSPTVMVETAAVITRPLPSEVVYVEDASVGRRIGSRRQGITGMDMVFETGTLEHADAMQSMLGSYEMQQVGTLCVRMPPPMRIPSTFFASVRDLDEVMVNIHRRGTITRFEMVVDETAGPYAALVVPLLTYDDIDAAYATYDLRDAAYATYTDADRDYSLAGYGGDN